MTLYIQETGPKDRASIVFLHGGGVSGWMWRPQIEQLAGDYHCLVPDLPEHGRSVGIKPLSIRGAAARVAEMIANRAHNGRAHVVGLSLGAQITVELLGMSPEVVDHAVISGALVRPLRGMKLIQIAVMIYMPFKDIDFLVRLNMKSAGIPAEYLEEFRADTQAMTAESFCRMIRENMSFRIPAGQKEAVPILVVVGQKEPKIMHGSALDLAAGMPNAKGCMAVDAGHNWNLQKPELFNSMVRAWIENRTLPEGILPLASKFDE